MFEMWTFGFINDHCANCVTAPAYRLVNVAFVLAKIKRYCQTLERETFHLKPNVKLNGPGSIEKITRL